MFLRWLFRRARQQPGRPGYDRESAARDEHADMKRVQKRLRDRAGMDKGFPSPGGPWQS